MEEVWKDVKGYEGLYQVSNLGRVKSLERKQYSNDKFHGRILRERVLIPNIENKWGYLSNKLTKNRIEKIYKIHRLVAEAFIPNPLNKPQVNHKDGNKKNNYVYNLEWCTSSENLKHAWETGLQPDTREGKSYRAKKVLQYDFNGNIIAEYPSVKTAKRITKCYHIGDVCNGKRNYAGNYLWKFKENKNGI